jgi:hypothetical protein
MTLRAEIAIPSGAVGRDRLDRLLDGLAGVSGLQVAGPGGGDGVFDRRHHRP